jgi:hypothetical protein
MNGNPASQEQSNIVRILSEARQDLVSQSNRILPDLTLLQDLYKTFLASGIIDDRKYLVRILLFISPGVQKHTRTTQALT